jgi:hypothetical protein
VADRLFVRIQPSASFTITSQPVITDGSDGQFVTIANVSTADTVTFPDEAIVAGSNLRFGGRNLELGPRESMTLVFVGSVGDWLLTQKPAGSAGLGMSGPSLVEDGQMALFNGITGNALEPFGGSGLVKASNGVPSIVAGLASDCVRVDGSSGPCGGEGNMTVPLSTEPGQMAVYEGTSGNTLATLNVTGVLKSANGVPSAVTGEAADCVRVDGSSGPCGSEGNITLPVSTEPGQMAVYEGTSGNTLATLNVSGVLKSANGVPSAVTGEASDCVRVDGSSGPCGAAGAITIMDYSWYATASNNTGSGGYAANGWTVLSSSGASIVANGTNATMTFGDSGTPTGIFPLVVPADWAGGPISIQMQYTPSSSGCSSGENIMWKVKTGAHSVNETANAYPSWGPVTAITHDLPLSAANKLQSVTLTGLDVSSWARGKRALISFERDGTADTGTCTIQLLGIELGLRRTLQ